MMIYDIWWCTENSNFWISHRQKLVHNVYFSKVICRKGFRLKHFAQFFPSWLEIKFAGLQPMSPNFCKTRSAFSSFLIWKTNNVFEKWHVAKLTSSVNLFFVHGKLLMFDVWCHTITKMVTWTTFEPALIWFRCCALQVKGGRGGVLNSLIQILYHDFCKQWLQEGFNEPLTTNYLAVSFSHFHLKPRRR